MRNSNIGNLSIAIPTQSRLRTFTQLQDKSLYIGQHDQPYHHTTNIIFNQNLQKQKWLSCRQKVSKRYISDIEQDSTKNSASYMIVIEEFSQINYRRKISKSKQYKQSDKYNQAHYRTQAQNISKVYLKLFANLVNSQTADYSARTQQFNLLQLQPKSNNIFKLSDAGIALFFHSKSNSQSYLKVRLQISVLQSSIIDSQQIVQHQEYIGYCDIDPFKGSKNRQKISFYSFRSNSFIDTTVAYLVLVSDAFKILQKLIPPNCLCNLQEQIPGLAGRKLPHNSLSLNYGIDYTQLNSIRIDVVSVDIPETTLNAKLKQAQLYAKYVQDTDNITITIKQVKLEGLFHNGWTIFSQGTVKIEDKMQIQRKNSKKPIGQIIKVKHFTSQQLLMIPFAFLDEETILIFQIVAKIQIRQKSKSALIQTLNIPICYSYYVINKLSSDQKQSRSLYIGEGVHQPTSAFAQKKYEAHGSKIQFYINIEHANKLNLSKHLVTLTSNKSHIDVERVMLQKQRMIRQNRKLRQQNKLKKIELNKQIPILDTTNFKQNLYRNQIEKLRQQRRQKQQVLEYLKRKVKQLDISTSQYNEDDSNINQDQFLQRKKFINKTNTQNYHNSLFYKATLDKNIYHNNSFISHQNYESIRVHAFPMFVNSQSAQIYPSGEVPVDVIKTEMLQKNYSYGIFINWISLIPASAQKKLPRKFYFETSFFKHQTLKSCLLSVNEINGQIMVLQSQMPKDTDKQQKNAKKLPKQTQQQKLKSETQTATKKIFFFQIASDQKIKNNDSNFIDFICYLYHSQLQIKIIDQISGVQFGQCFFKLRDIIRMRRNQCVALKQLWVSKEGEAKAKLKVEIKSIKKQPKEIPKPKAPSISPLQAIVMQPEARQLHRIAAFKKSRDIQTTGSSYSKVQRMISQQLTKQQFNLNVFRMKGEFIRIQVTNKKNYTQSYQIKINDPDQSYLRTQQIVVINSLLFRGLGQTGWWKFIQAINDKIKDIIVVKDGNCFELNPGQTGAILLYYYSQRKYKNQYKQASKILFQQTQTQIKTNNNNANIPNGVDLLQVYNHMHCIDLTLCNPLTSALHHIYKLHINPQPDSSILHYKYVRRNNSKIFIDIPYIPSQKFIVYIDDPTIISTLNQKNNSVSLDCFVGNQGQCRNVNVSILSPFPQNRFLMGYSFQLWGARQIYVEGKLWEVQEVLVDMHSSICIQKGLQFALVLSEDEKVIFVRENNPIKINHKQSKTMIRLNITPTFVRSKSYQLVIISPIDFSLVYRYSLKINTIQPPISQKIILRVKLTDKMIEQPFGFKNQLPRKQKFRILSTHPHILWTQQEQFEVEGRGEKNIKININAQQVIQTQMVVLGFLGERACFYYLFVLQLDNML